MLDATMLMTNGTVVLTYTCAVAHCAERERERGSQSGIWGPPGVLQGVSQVSMIVSDC